MDAVPPNPPPPVLGLPVPSVGLGEKRTSTRLTQNSRLHCFSVGWRCVDRQIIVILVAAVFYFFFIMLFLLAFPGRANPPKKTKKKTQTFCFLKPWKNLSLLSWFLFFPLSYFYSPAVGSGSRFHCCTRGEESVAAKDHTGTHRSPA